MSVATVLIADDDPVMLAGLCLQARYHGLQPIAVGEGEVLSAARRHRPTVIVLDIHQRGFDGRDVLAQLKADPATCGSEVVVISGREERSTQAECLALGAAAFRRKPVEWEFMESVAHLAYDLARARDDGAWTDLASANDVEVIALDDTGEAVEPPWLPDEIEVSLED
jgi:CheY-like chemotaxis protein